MNLADYKDEAKYKVLDSVRGISYLEGNREAGCSDQKKDADFNWEFETKEKSDR